MKAQPEYQLQVAVCDYLRVKYPGVMFMSDTIAAVIGAVVTGALTWAVRNVPADLIPED